MAIKINTKLHLQFITLYLVSKLLNDVGLQSFWNLIVGVKGCAVDIDFKWLVLVIYSVRNR